MQANQPLGLLKFFHNPEYMEMFLSGFMHCQPPEVFRLAAQEEGRGDKYESCTMSWRRSRGDPDIEITLNGRVIAIEDVVSMTVQNDGDSWLSCWFALRLPDEESDLEKLKADLTRLKREFGKHFVFIPAFNVQKFLDRLRVASSEPVWAHEVTYEEGSVLWSSRCKSPAYSYQREFRFGFGKCDVHETDAYTFTCDGGFRDIISSDVSLQLSHKNTGEVFLELLEL